MNYIDECDELIEHVRRNGGVIQDAPKQRHFDIKLFLFAQKYRFDLAAGFLSFINFAMLALLLSRQAGITNISAVALSVAAVLIGVWALGYVLDRVIKAGQQLDRQVALRSGTWQEQRAKLDRIEAMLEMLSKKK